LKGEVWKSTGIRRAVDSGAFLCV